VYEGGIPPPSPAPAAKSASQRRLRAAAVVGGLLAAEKAQAQERESMQSTVSATAQGRELGELFEYRFDSPVSVRKDQSAMLPFLQQKLAARKLLIYSDQTSAHPRNAAEITNSTGKTLDGGPITVYDAQAYAGEALMETLKAGDKRLISYAIDIGTRISAKLDSDPEMVREIHFRRGILTTRAALKETKTYTIHNVDQKDKTLIIEHPIRPGYKLLNQKPFETTSSFYRFEVKLPAGSTENFPVSEERLLDRTVAVANQTPDFLLTFVQNKSLDEAARKQLERIAALKQQIVAVDNDIRQTETDINELVRDQDRIRQNIASLNRVSGQQEQVQKYARDLAAQEGRLASLRDRLSDLRKKKSALESQLNSLMDSIVF
jgi:hypothetical protein